MEELITVEQLAKLTGYSKQTIYNKINKEEFILGIHYLKPTRKKILFMASAIQQWLTNGEVNEDHGSNNKSESMGVNNAGSAKERDSNSSNIQPLNRISSNRIRI